MRFFPCTVYLPIEFNHRDSLLQLQLHLRGAPTEEAEAAALRAASEELLLAAAAQVLGATTAVLLPACKLATIFATLLGSMTGYCASDVLWLLVACHGYVHGDLRVYYGFFVAMFLVALLVGLLASLGPCF
jgi:hypothetical protein